MKILYCTLIFCLIANAVSSDDCPKTPCPSGEYCVRTLGSTSCVRPAKKKHMCSSEPGREEVYDMLPPCNPGLTCDTQLTVAVCK
ncbi:hypothetical protein NPIL_570571 [Nephila pilipes]|uniref:Uncharacterized protein n=1 Tax=Nephila pilipes TaxID=299642 RepID=A0A8X6QQK6_NEPPI|nr:hypothetical protein NPIL_570571 [Nephila pilipes]